MSNTQPKIAIACQGGGSLTAYQAGMLARLLKEAHVRHVNNQARVFLSLPAKAFGKKSDGKIEFELVGISGTSGGAQNAAIAWNACVTGNPAGAEATLQHWWNAISAHADDLSMSGGLTHTMVRMYDSLLTFLNLQVQQRQNAFDSTIRETFIAQMRSELPKSLWDGPETRKIHDLPLYVASMEAISGTFVCFMVGAKYSEKYQKSGIEPMRKLDPRFLMASACIPELFTEQTLPMSQRASNTFRKNQSVRLAEPSLRTKGLISPEEAKARWSMDEPLEGQYWDGLYSENPPISPFLRFSNEDLKPDEILILRINPRTVPESIDEPTRLVDRQNELIGNLSLTQEIHSIKKVNGFLKKWYDLGVKPDDKITLGMKPVAVREIDLPWQEQEKLRYSDKLARRPEEIRRRMDVGYEWADLFLTGTKNQLTDWAEPDFTSANTKPVADKPVRAPAKTREPEHA